MRLTFSQAIFSFNLVKRLWKMPEIRNSDLKILQQNIKEGEHMICFLKEEIKQLMSIVGAKQEAVKANIIQDENRKLQNEINLVKKELIKLQVANGVPQIPLPGEIAEEKTENPAKPPITETTVSESKQKTKAAPKPKKQVAVEADESPVDIGRLDIRVGKVLEARTHPDADKLYIEQVDIGEEKPRTIISGLANHVPIAELDQRLVVVLCNLKPQKMRGVMSEGMLLCASTPDAVELLDPPAGAQAGDNVTVPGFTRQPDLPFMNPKKKIFEAVAPDLKVNEKNQASYKNVTWKIDGKDGLITSKSLCNCQIK